MAGTAFIGFDFGSSLIKVAVRLADVGAAQADHRSAFGIAFDGHRRDHQYKVFRQTAIWVIGNGPDRRVCVKAAPAGGRALAVTGIKEALIAAYMAGTENCDQCIGDSGLTPLEATVLLTAWTLQQSKRAIDLFVRDRGVHTPGSFIVNCAVPSSDTLQVETQDGLSESACPYRTRFRNLVERARIAVFQQAAPRVPDEMGMTQAKAVAQSIMAIPLPTDPGQHGTGCLPESLAAVLAAVGHARFHNGLYLVFDVGAFTTDASLFYFHPRPEYRIMTYYSTGTCPAGVGPDLSITSSISPTRASNLRAAIEEMYREMIRAMRERYDVSSSRAFERSMFTDRTRVWTPKWRSVLLGGGASIPEVHRFVADLRVRSAHADADLVAPMADPPMTFPTETYSDIVFVNQNSGRATHSIAALGQPGLVRYRQEAVDRASHILQLSIGLTTNILDCPPWSAAERTTEENRPENVPYEAWRQYNPWTGF
jgi:hypothetical protein